MFPGFTKNNLVDCSNVHPVFPGKGNLGTSGNIPSLNFENLGFGKFGFVMFGTLKTSTFFSHVMRVFGRATEEKVGRADTKPVVTAGTIMTDGHTFRYFTKGKFPSPTVGVNAHGFTVNSFDSSPITALIDAALPQPALAARFINVAPKGFLCGNLTGAVACTTAKFSGPVRDAIGLYKIGSAAVLAKTIGNFRGFYAIMRLHGNSPFRVMPPAATNSAGALCC
jgi:hypothetical protein